MKISVYLNDHMTNNPPLISLQEAADLLGYATTKSVTDLINRGKLSAYKYPHRKRTLVSEEEVKQMLIPVKVQS